MRLSRRDWLRKKQRERLLREQNVLVQPGYFYDFERAGISGAESC